MSALPSSEPACTSCPATPAVELAIEGRPRDLGGFQVRRLLPSVERRLVGPFIFFDQMGPAHFAPGGGIDVRPHPHIGLATVTYLFQGEILHRDSLGSHQTIVPGDINWMTAGRGIVHSERTRPEVRAAGPVLDGLQLWIALPTAHEEAEPEFHHHPGASLPEIERDGARIRVLAGTAFGERSPVHTHSPLLYVDVALPAGRTIQVPREHAERALYVVQGAVVVGAERAVPGRMLVLTPGVDVVLRAEVDTRLVLVGGAPLDGPRHVFWNFVSSSLDRIEQAKAQWRERRFPGVPGDEEEFIPLPE